MSSVTSHLLAQKFPHLNSKIIVKIPHSNLNCQFWSATSFFLPIVSFRVVLILSPTISNAQELLNIEIIKSSKIYFSKRALVTFSNADIRRPNSILIPTETCLLKLLLDYLTMSYIAFLTLNTESLFCIHFQMKANPVSSRLFM